jgi:hypothetical protein
MKQLLFACCLIRFLSLSNECFSQDLLWGSHFSSTVQFPFSGSGPMSTYVDTEGNVYITGQFSGKIDFDPGPDTLFLDASSHTEIFLVKMNANGTLLWAKQFEGTNLAIGNTIVGDDLNEIYISGQIRGKVDFDLGPDTVSINAGNQDAGFLVKLTLDGEFVWVKKYGIIFNSLRRTVDGNLIAIGSFNGSKDIDPGTGVTSMVSNGGFDIAIVKLTSLGDLIWARGIGGADDDNGQSCDADMDGNIYFTGSFQETVDFDPGPDSTKLSALGIFLYDDIFICKFNAFGEFIWVNGFGSSGYPEAGNIIRVDGDQNLVVAGRFIGSVDFDPGPGTYQLNAGGGSGSFVCKYTTEGKYVWAKSFESPAEVNTTVLDIDNSNFITCAGSFKVRADFNPYGQSYFLTAPGGLFGNAFVCNLNPEGKFRWAIPFESDEQSNCNSIMYDQHHNLYATGEFYKKAEFYPGADTLIFEVPGSFLNGYLVKLHTCDPTIADIAIAACNEYISPSGKYTWTLSGIYHDSIYNQQGCDSIITIDLEVLHTDTMVIFEPPTLTASLSGNVAYQWLDCNNGNAIISGETSQSFTPPSSGSYAVALYPDDMCFDTSSCINVTLVGIPSFEKNVPVLLYPNPSSEELHISFPEETSVDLVVIWNLAGEIISQLRHPSKDNLLNCRSFAKGMYIAQIFTEDKRVSFQKFIIQ